MAKNTFRDVSKKLTPVDLAVVESALKIVLPDPVKSHYLEYNGGAPERTCWELESGEALCITDFLPMMYAFEDGRTMESVYLKGLKRNFLVKGLVPFANDWGGNYFCFDDEGRVYFYSIDNWSDRRSTEDNKRAATKFLLPSFAEFIDRLKFKEAA